MSDGKYFASTKKGEVAEYRTELRDNKLEVRREAVKKVIAAMTVGLDVEMLFPDMILCMNTTDIELKKLVYLYIINYARVKRNRDTVLLAVNTFVNDSQCANPLLRALAVRTMGCIRVEKISEYLIEPIKKAIRDEDPYVRKTAALCIAKLADVWYTSAAQSKDESADQDFADKLENSDFVSVLHELLGDNTPMVVANTVAALAEIQQYPNISGAFTLTPSTLHKLLKALDECTEWGQVLILDAVAKYKPEGYQEAEGTIDRVVPRLSHNNGAVVMGAIRVILQFLGHARDKDFIKQTCRKLAPPIVTLMSGPAEVQYVTLRSISIIVQRRPKILENQFRVFFCKYNDPAYVKFEKLEVLFKLANIRNIEELLNELKEYALEVDVEIARRAVRLIGRCAIKLEQGAQMCIDVLVELIQTEIKHIVQETIVVMKDIYRRYPNQYEELVKLMHDAFTTDEDEDEGGFDGGGNKVDLNDLEPDAKAAMIWIIGEYAERIDDAELLLENTVFGDEQLSAKDRQRVFAELPVRVRMELLIASVKTFLKADEDQEEDNPAEELVKEVIELCDCSSDPDLRMRSFVYWRLLAVDPGMAKQVVLADKPEVSTDQEAIEPALLEQLMSHVSTLAAVYHIPPEQLAQPEELNEDQEEPEEDEVELTPASPYMEPNRAQAAAPEEAYEDDEDEEDEDQEEDEEEEPEDLMTAEPSARDPDGLADLMGDLMGPPAAGPSCLQPPQGMTVVLPAQQFGLQVECKVERGEGHGGEGIFLWVSFKNQRASPVSSVDLKLNRNTFGLAKSTVSFDGKTAAQEGPSLLHPGVPGMPLQPQGQLTCAIRLVCNPSAVQQSNPLLNIQAAIKIDASPDHGYFNIECPLYAVMAASPALEKGAYMRLWKNIPEEADLTLNTNVSVEQLLSKLEASHFLIIHQRDSPEGTVIYTCAVTESACPVWCLATLTVNHTTISVKVKCEKPMIAPFTEKMFTQLFGAVSAVTDLEGLF